MFRPLRLERKVITLDLGLRFFCLADVCVSATVAVVSNVLGLEAARLSVPSVKMD